MVLSFKTALAGGMLAALTATALPAAAMPVAAPGASSAIITVSGWATRASGRRHTYPTYGYEGYYGGVQSPYGGWQGDAYAAPYGGGYGRALPPAYIYGGDDDSY